MSIESEIKSAAIEVGFDLVAIAPATPSPHSDYFREFAQSDSAGDMDWLVRDPLKRINPRSTYPQARSILVVGQSYNQSHVNPVLLSDPSRGRISSYAWGKDYHKLMAKRLKKLYFILRDSFGDIIEGKWHVDTGPLLEKPNAALANLGFIGKHTLLIRPHWGSYFFLGELLLSTELKPDSQPATHFGCGECHRCGTACPTGALDQPYRLDIPKCISYWTIEHSGPIPRSIRSKIGNWIFGCDLCQLACPYNARLKNALSEERFKLASDDYAAPKLSELAELTEDEFNNRFAGSGIRRTKRNGFLRNVAIALGNWGEDEAIDALDLLLHDDEPLVRGHAAWGLANSGNRNALILLIRQEDSERDDYVREEIELAVTSLMSS